MSHLKFNTLRKWLYSNTSLENINRLCLIGSITLYAFGIRNIGDIDGIFMSKPDNTQEAELIELLNSSFSNKQTKIDFIDIGIKNSKYWKDSWEEKNKKVIEYFGLNNFDDVVYNPKYHFNFHGIKIYLFEYELVRKIFRLDDKNYNQNMNYYINQSAKDYTDFIILYFYYRNLLGHYAYLNTQKKLLINDDFKINPINLNNLDDHNKSIFINVIKNNLKRYPKEQSEKITENRFI